MLLSGNSLKDTIHINLISISYKPRNESAIRKACQVNILVIKALDLETQELIQLYEYEIAEMQSTKQCLCKS